jgi:hypothetical protein
MKIRSTVCAIALAALAAIPTFAATDAVNTNTVSSTLAVNVNVVKAIRLTLATGTQCAISAGGGTDFTMNFGTVDALGISAATCGSKFTPATSTDAAKYYSDYTLTPSFTSQSSTTGAITAYVSTDFTTAAGLLSVVKNNTLPGSAAALTAMTLSNVSQDSIGTSLANNAAVTRYIGVAVAPMNGAGTLTGAAAATVTYTLTAP